MARTKTTSGSSARPTIVVTDAALPDMVKATWNAIHLANSPPSIFQRGGTLVRVCPKKESILPVTKDWLFQHVASVANWVRQRAGGTVPSFPKREVVNTLLAAPDPALPELTSVVTTPVFSERRRLIAAGGYHCQERVYYSKPRGWKMRPVSAAPSPMEVESALWGIQVGLLDDFPFSGASDRAHVVAALLQPFARSMIGGPTPLHLLEAPTPGTGKTLICELVSLVATGAPARSTTLPKSDDEIRKKITAELVAGKPIVVFDNIDSRHGQIASASLAGALTATTWEDRRLGSSHLITVPNRALWMMTGNNPRISTEIARRTVRSRIDAGDSRPWIGREFRVADIRQWTRDHRPQLVHAALTLIRAWIREGAPRYRAKKLGGFEQWSEVIGGVLEVAGVDGFLDDVEEFYAEADADREEWCRFARTWWSEFGGSSQGVRDLAKLCDRESLLPEVIGNGPLKSRETRLGRELLNNRDQIFDGYQIKMVSPRLHGKTYALAAR